jgi:hypothetical protein
MALCTICIITANYLAVELPSLLELVSVSFVWSALQF